MLSICDPQFDVLVANAEDDHIRMVSNDTNFTDFDFNEFMEGDISTNFASNQFGNSSWNSEHFQLPLQTDVFIEPLYQNDFTQLFVISAGCAPAPDLNIVQQNLPNDLKAQDVEIVDQVDAEVSQLAGFDPIKVIFWGEHANGAVCVSLCSFWQYLNYR
jgi:hypothetical protein